MNINAFLTAIETFWSGNKILKIIFRMCCMTCMEKIDVRKLSTEVSSRDMVESCVQENKWMYPSWVCLMPWKTKTFTMPQDIEFSFWYRNTNNYSRLADQTSYAYHQVEGAWQCLLCKDFPKAFELKFYATLGSTPAKSFRSSIFPQLTNFFHPLAVNP